MWQGPRDFTAAMNGGDLKSNHLSYYFFTHGEPPAEGTVYHLLEKMVDMHNEIYLL